MELIAIAVGIALALFCYKVVGSAYVAARKRKASGDMEAFLRACVFVDDELTFARSYALVVRNSAILQRAFLSRDRKRFIGAEDYDPALPAAVVDVLTTLDGIGTIFRYATDDYASNEQLIDERAADLVVKAHDALFVVLRELQQDNPTLFNRFDELYAFCQRRQRVPAGVFS